MTELSPEWIETIGRLIISVGLGVGVAAAFRLAIGESDG